MFFYVSKRVEVERKKRRKNEFFKEVNTLKKKHTRFPNSYFSLQSIQIEDYFYTHKTNIQPQHISQITPTSYSSLGDTTFYEFLFSFHLQNHAGYHRASFLINVRDMSCVLCFNSYPYQDISYSIDGIQWNEQECKKWIPHFFSCYKEKKNDFYDFPMSDFLSYYFI